MQRTFEEIAQPFQNGQVELPAGIAPQIGIVANTYPPELEQSILDVVDGMSRGLRDQPSHQPELTSRPSPASIMLARTVDKEISRLGRRQYLATALAGTVLGACAGLSSFTIFNPQSFEAPAGATSSERAAHASDPLNVKIADSGFTAAMMIAGTVGGLYAATNLNGTFARRKAQKIIAQAQNASPYEA